MHEDGARPLGLVWSGVVMESGKEASRLPVEARSEA